VPQRRRTDGDSLRDSTSNEACRVARPRRAAPRACDRFKTTKGPVALGHALSIELARVAMGMGRFLRRDK